VGLSIKVNGLKVSDTDLGQWNGLMVLLIKANGAMAVQQFKEFLNIPMVINIKEAGVKI